MKEEFSSVMEQKEVVKGMQEGVIPNQQLQTSQVSVLKQETHAQIATLINRLSSLQGKYYGNRALPFIISNFSFHSAHWILLTL